MGSDRLWLSDPFHRRPKATPEPTADREAEDAPSADEPADERPVSPTRSVRSTTDEIEMLHRARAAFSAAAERPGPADADGGSEGEVAAASAGSAPLPVREVPAHRPGPQDADDEDGGTGAGDAVDDETAHLLLEAANAMEELVGVFSWPGGAVRWLNEALARRAPSVDASLMVLLDEWSQAHFLVRALPELLRAGRWQGRLGFHAGDGPPEPMAATVTAHRVDGQIDAITLFAYPWRDPAPPEDPEELVTALVQHVTDLILVVALDGSITYLSPGAADLLGLDEEPGDSTPRFSQLLHPEDRPEDLGDLVRVGADGEDLPVRLRVRDEQGDWRHVDAVWTDLSENPVVAGFVVNAHDVTDEVTAGRALAEQAFTDELTGLPNRVRLFDRMDSWSRQGPASRPLTLVLVNLDHFRGFQERHSEADTDTALMAVARRIVTTSPDAAMVIRLRADEFAVAVPDLDESELAVELADELRSAVAEPLVVGDRTARVTASIGVALGSVADATEDLLVNADRAMRRAKELGRDCVSVFDETSPAHHRPRASVDRQLERALDTDALQMRYQPIVDLDSLTVVGTEALMRVRGEDGALLSPAEFVDAAESTGLIWRLGTAVLRTTCEQVSRLSRVSAASDLEVSVNVSPRQIAHPRFASGVLETLEECGIESDRLWLEITEGTLLGRDDASETNIVRLRDRGVRIGLDEFGGYTSLGYLRRFPLDFVKIERNLVAGLGGNYVDGAIVRTTIELAQKLGLTTVAVGVENEAQRQLLRELGCKWGQGYLFAPAVRADELALVLSNMTRP